MAASDGELQEAVDDHVVRHLGDYQHVSHELASHHVHIDVAIVDPPGPYDADTALCGVIVVPPLRVPDEFRTLTVGDREVHFLAVVPLHADEMDLKLEQGANALLDPARPSAL